MYNLHTDGRAQYSKTVKKDSSQLCLLVHALCLCINQLALACAWKGTVYNLHTDKLGLACAWVYNLQYRRKGQYSKTVKKDSSQLCLLVHALCWCIISTSTSLCLGV